MDKKEWIKTKKADQMKNKVKRAIHGHKQYVYVYSRKSKIDARTYIENFIRACLCVCVRAIEKALFALSLYGRLRCTIGCEWSWSGFRL